MVLDLGLAAAGLALLVRATPGIPNAWKTRKPLSCAVCMAFWSTLALAAWTRPGIVEALASVALAAAVYRFVYPPPVELPAGFLEGSA